MPIKIQSENILKNFKEGFIGINGANKKLKQALIGINGVNKVLWEKSLIPVKQWEITPFAGGSQSSYPTALSISTEGNLYYADGGQSGEQTLNKMSPEGNKLNTVNVFWSSGGILCTAVDKFNNDVYAGGWPYSESEQKLYKYNSNLGSLWQFANNKKDVAAVAIDSNRNVYIDEYNSDVIRVKKINSAGVLQWTKSHNIGTTGDRIYAIAVDSNYALYLGTKSGNLVKLDSLGNRLWVKKLSGNAVVTVKVDITDNIWVTNGYKLLKYDVNGNLILEREYSQYNTRDVAIDMDNNVYLTSSDGIVRKLNQNGDVIWQHNFHTGMVLRVIVDHNLNVYTSGYNDEKIIKVAQV